MLPNRIFVQLFKDVFVLQLFNLLNYVLLRFMLYLLNYVKMSGVLPCLPKAPNWSNKKLNDPLPKKRNCCLELKVNTCPCP